MERTSKLMVFLRIPPYSEKNTKGLWMKGVKTSDLDLSFRYYFPTYENDALLCTLSDSDEGESEETRCGEGIPVIAEDMSGLRALKQTSVLNQLLKHRSSCS